MTLLYCVRLIRHIAPLLGKPEERFNWNLETDKIMSKVVFLYFIFCIIDIVKYQNMSDICTSALQGGPDNSSKPFVWLKLESINNFDDPATVKTLTPQIYQFLQSELQFEKVGLLSSYPLPFPYPVH